jgi:hydrogenase maturation factor HypF (carbamoyltransferase family)
LQTLKKNEIFCALQSDHPMLQKCVEDIANKLPASCFLSGSKHYEVTGEPDSLAEYDTLYPLGLGLCPSCQKEMFDPSSRRYYYPFTSCTHCGGKYSFFTKFPYKRENTSFRFLTPCKECSSEMQSFGIRENHHENSCHQCGVAVRMRDKKSERYANDAGSFRTLFEVAAKALVDNKKVLIKTTFGYRVFYKLTHKNSNSVLMLLNANKIASQISMIEKEFNALLSIERPVLHVALQDEHLRTIFGNSWDVKYPDEGFTILLAKELGRLGEEYICYEDVDDTYEADILIDYDLEVTSQSDMHLFINKDVTFIASGERVSFPSKIKPTTNAVCVAHGLVGLKYEDVMLFDKIEHFESVHATKSVVLHDETKYDSNQQVVEEDEASFSSVIAEHGIFGEKCVGVHFDSEASFLYYDGKNVIRAVPAKKFQATELLSKISSLREGSDRLMENFKVKYPQIYKELEVMQEREEMCVFEAAAVILELKEHSFASVSREAMRFMGKGGLQVDTRVSDNRFDHTAFLASLVSYRLGGADSVMLAYSIFESFGDYFNEILGQLMAKTKAQKIILTGSGFSNHSLFSRMQRNLKLTPPFMNINYPICKENAVVGGVYL